MIPGRALHRLTRICCSPAFCVRVMEPLLADLQHERLSVNGYLRPPLTLVSGYAAFWSMFGSHGLRTWGGEIRQMTWRDAFPYPGVRNLRRVCEFFASSWFEEVLISGRAWSG
jgi:hypothetical protein